MRNFVQIPPMPKPEDFGITDDDWNWGALSQKVCAYKEALEVWKHAVASIRTSPPKE